MCIRWGRTPFCTKIRFGEKIFFHTVTNADSCLHNLLPQRRNSDTISRLRWHTTYLIPWTRTNKCRSFTHYAFVIHICITLCALFWCISKYMWMWTGLKWAFCVDCFLFCILCVMSCYALLAICTCYCYVYVCISFSHRLSFLLNLSWVELKPHTLQCLCETA